MALVPPRGSAQERQERLLLPRYERIAEAAGCARSTVAEAIKSLEAAGILSSVTGQAGAGALQRSLGGQRLRWRVLRTSNAYNFRDPGAT